MAVTVRVKVLRAMVGDDGKGGNKRFEKGEYRTLAPADAERLAATGALEVVSKAKRERPKPVRQAPAAKRARAPKNKQEAPPANKGGQ